jgi:hypothetical protein
MMDDNILATVLKTAALLVVIAAEWWAMQPYHEPMLAKLWQFMARLCYRIAHRFGSLGLTFEHQYYQAV